MASKSRSWKKNKKIIPKKLDGSNRVTYSNRDLQNGKQIWRRMKAGSLKE